MQDQENPPVAEEEEDGAVAVPTISAASVQDKANNAKIAKIKTESIPRPWTTATAP